MKKILVIIVCILLLGLSSCVKYPKTSLHPTTDFIQGWYCQDFDINKWNHLITCLKEEGYENIVLQSTSDSTNFVIDETYYPSIYSNPNHPLELLLRAAKENNFGVYIGLLNDDDWWNTDLYTEEYMSKWAKLQIEIVKDIYNLYYEDYKDTIKGFYLSFELYTNDSFYELSWAKMINELRSGMLEINNTIPLVFSPFTSSSYPMTKSQLQGMWNRFFRNVNLTNIDLCVPQDGFGGKKNEFSDEDYHQITNNLKTINKAINKYSQCQMGVNIEFYTSEEAYATKERINKQLSIASMYGNTVFSFSYSHYYYRPKYN